MPIDPHPANTPKLIIAQLSDIHLDRSKPNPVLARVGEIVGALRSVGRGEPKHCLLLFSGDLAYRGVTEEYDIARGFIEELRKAIAAEGWAAKTTLLFVPGNHDCDYTRHNLMRPLAGKQARTGVMDSATIDAATVVQEPYFAFLSSFEGSTPSEVRLYKEVSVPIGARLAKFHLFNTAWLCEPSTNNSDLTDQGRLYVPLSQITLEGGAADVHVTVMHHPTHWLESENKREFEGQLEPLTHLWFCGHEHRQSGYTKVTHSGHKFQAIEGGVLQDSYDSGNSSFNVLLLDLEEAKYRLYEFHWDKSMYAPSSELPEWLALPHDPTLSRREFEVRADFSSFVDDLGIALTHPYKTPVLLPDLFVWPDLADLPSVSDVGRTAKLAPPVLRSEKVLDKLLERDRWLILGDEQSGKTTLAKRFFWELHRRDWVPLLVDAEDIKSAGEAEISRVIRVAFERTYSTPSPAKFDQLVSERRAIILDNLDLLSLPPAQIKMLVARLEQDFKKVILFSRYHPATYETNGVGISALEFLAGYTMSNIEELSYRARELLISHWVGLGRNGDGGEAVEAEVRRVKSIVDTVLRTQFIPASPLLVLGLLQHLEAATPGDSGVGTYGHLFEIIIKVNLARAGQERVQYDTKINFLSGFAYRLRCLGKRWLGEAELRAFYKEYQSEYDETTPFESLIKDCVENGLLATPGGGVEFRYPHLYHYFLAYYTRNSLHQPEISDLVRDLGRTLHLDESGKVMLFLSHLTKDELVIGSVLEAAKGLLAGLAECNLDGDVITLNGKFANEIAERYTEIVPSEERLRRASALDEAAHSQRLMVAEENKEADLEVLNELGQVNLAMKTLDILGQILKSFAGSLTADRKREIMDESFKLSLRSLTALLTFIEVGEDEIAGMLKRRKAHGLGRDLTASEQERVQRDVQMFAFWFGKMLARWVIGRVAMAVGTERAEPTLLHVVKKAGQENEAKLSTAYQLIDMAIRLECYREFPEVPVRDMNERLESKPFPHQILCSLVLDHFKVFERPFNVRQRAIKVLGIRPAALPPAPRKRRNGRS